MSTYEHLLTDEQLCEAIALKLADSQRETNKDRANEAYRQYIALVSEQMHRKQRKADDDEALDCERGRVAYG